MSEDKNKLEQIFNRDKVCICKDKSSMIKITWKELNDIKDHIIIPEIQTTLNLDKINEMKKSYIDNPHFMLAKSLIVLAHTKLDTKDIYYLVDGQHRFNMATELYKEKKINETFLLSVIEINNLSELLALFAELNIDSSKCVIKKGTFIEFELLNYYELKKLMNIKYNFLSKSSSINKILYTISEFIDELIKLDCFKNLGISNLQPIEILEHIEIKERDFFDKVGYLELRTQSEDKFKVSEKNCIDNKSCMFMKNNNFIFWLNKKTTLCNHDFTERKPIDKKLKNKVWVAEFGAKTSGKCTIYNCTNILSLDIVNSWQCGHKQSVKNKGNTTLENLRPLCSFCNQSMGENNWDKWIYDKMMKDIINNFYEDEVQKIKCKVKNCKNKINIHEYRPFIFESSKTIPKPICISCYDEYVN